MLTDTPQPGRAFKSLGKPSYMHLHAGQISLFYRLMPVSNNNNKSSVYEVQNTTRNSFAV